MINIELYNNIFTSYNDSIKVVQSFKATEHNVFGIIVIETEKGALKFDVTIPNSFPFGQKTTSIQFKCDSIKGYEHQNLDNSICLHPTPNHNADEKLKQEIDLLLDWIQEYYIEERTDSTYNYLQHYNESFCMYFDSKKAESEQGSYGLFNYVDISGNRRFANFIALSIGNEKSSFSNYYHNLENKNEGVWLYIEKEPIIENRLIAQNWDDLNPYVKQEQVDFLYKYQQDLNKNKKYFFVMLGYKIFNSSSTEIHWELIIIPRDFSFSNGVKENKSWISKLNTEKIPWCKSSNITYDRFFGRGRLHEKITQSNVLIIGTGALGSSLAKIIVRGGATRIELSDFDIVESGNLCRSEFFLFDESESKTISLLNQLTVISPFVEVTPRFEIPKTLPNNESFSTIKSQLSKFDIIFDCTTDMEMAYMLDKMNLKAEIFNFSITDKAKEFVCVYGGNNVAIQKHEIFKNLNIVEEEIDFYPEAGCGYPTFQANYNDINTLLNYCLNIINQRFEFGRRQNTFVLNTNKEFGNFKIDINEY